MLSSGSADAMLPFGLTSDGGRIWTGGNEFLSIVTPGATIPWTVTAGVGGLYGFLYDGSNVWATNGAALLKLDPAGAVLQTVTVGAIALSPVFDGANIWVPNYNSASVSVVRAGNGAVLATLTGNGLDMPDSAAFDGQRILVTNRGSGAGSVSLWKAADLTPIGTFSTGAGTLPLGACSDGINFWIALGNGFLARF